MEFADAIPLMALGPGITTILAFVFINETLTLKKIFGICILIIGTYILEAKKDVSIGAQLKEITNSKHIKLILYALLIYSVVSLIDRVVLSRYGMSPVTLIAFAHLFLVFSYIVMISIFYKGIKDIKHGFKKSGRWIFVMAVLVFGYRFLEVNAIKIAEVGLVTSIKRMSVLFALIIGREFFHEKKNLRKFLSAAVMVAGSILIAI